MFKVEGVFEKSQKGKSPPPPPPKKIGKAMIIRSISSLGDDSKGKVFLMKAGGPEFDPKNPL